MRFQAGLEEFLRKASLTEQQEQELKPTLDAAFDSLSEDYITDLVPWMTAIVQSNDECGTLKEIIDDHEDDEPLEEHASGGDSDVDMNESEQGKTLTSSEYLETRRKLVENVTYQKRILESLLTALDTWDGVEHIRDYTRYLIGKVTKIETRFVRELSKHEYAHKQELAGMGPSWVGAFHFADEGSFGKTSLWAKQNTSGVITDVSKALEFSDVAFLTVP